jgi:glycosyltransferase involved in cell wall biosynthesis
MSKYERRVSDKKGRRKSIDLQSFVSEMPRLYKAADAFVLPSRGEGWGMPMMEAMGMGVRILSPSVLV